MKILILEANPRQDLSLDKEIRSLRRVIDDAGDRTKFRIKDGAAVRKDRLHELLLSFEAEEPKDDPMIVHFCGHGTGEKGLVFENQQGNSDLVSTNTLKDFFALFEKRVVCVVMNACYSEIQAEAINKHIKYVIGMNQAIRDDAAIAFSIGFYRALGYDKSIENSFGFGKNAIQLAIGDDPKSREAIAEEMRKLVPIGEVSETNIEEHLKPVLKVNPDIIFPEPISPTPIVNEFNQVQIKELQKDIEFLTLDWQVIKEEARTEMDNQRKRNLLLRADKIKQTIQEKQKELYSLSD